MILVDRDRFKLRKREKEMKDLMKKAMTDLSSNGQVRRIDKQQWQICSSLDESCHFSADFLLIALS